MKSAISHLDATATLRKLPDSSPESTPESTLETYRRLLAGVLRGSEDGAEALSAVIQELPDEVRLGEALEEHWRTVESSCAESAIQRGREAQAELAAAYERRSDVRHRSAQTLAEAFAQKSRQLEALLECLPAMTYLKDDLLAYLFVDESYAALLGRTGSQIVSRTDRDLFPAAAARRFEELDREALEQGVIVESLDVIDTPEGALRVRALRSPVTAAHGRPTSLLGVLFKEEDPLPQAGRAGRQVAQVAHELRTPLTAAKEAIAVIQDGAAGPLTERQKDFAEIAARNCARLHRLLECAIEVERLTAGAPAPVMAETGLEEIVEAACERARPWTPGLTLTPAPHAPGMRTMLDAEIAVKMLAELIILASHCAPSRAVSVRWRNGSAHPEVIIDCEGAIGSLFAADGPVGISLAFVLRAAAAHRASTGVRLSGPYKGVYVEFPALVDESEGGEGPV